MIVHITADAVQYVGGTVTETTGKDISGGTFEIGLSSSSSTPPTSWLTPDVSVAGDSVAVRVVKLLVSETLPTGSPVVAGSRYYCWVRAHDVPEVVPLMVQGPIDVV